MGRVSQSLALQRGHLFPWLAVIYAAGIAVFFALRFEPTGMHYGVGAVLVALLTLAAILSGDVARPVLLACLFFIAGLLVAGTRAHFVAGPVLDWRYYGPVEGRVVAMDRSASDAVRLTLDQVVLENRPFDATPVRVRISLHGDAAAFGPPPPGARVLATANLGPPGGAVEPRGFDFQRHAWFLRLGAVGYTRAPVLALEPADGQFVFRARMQTSERVRAILEGDTGGFAAAVTTGDRSGISQSALEALRAANTAHLLAISGLHMGLLSAFVFGLLRVTLVLIPGVALRWPVRRIAAAGALAAASVYLALSGGNVATERAFIMVAVALCAVLLDRRALTLRAVAIAALIVLTLRPEALLGPGFQMSFAATTALVAVFSHLRQNSLGWGIPGLGWFMSLLISSAVAGLATAPIGAAHFNAVSHYGLMANLMSVPVMGILVIPAAVLSGLLALVGLEAFGLVLMGWGLQWILAVSHFWSGLEGARSFVPGPPGYVLPMIALGALCVILWQGRARWIGAVPVLCAFVIWAQVERPALLIAEGGTLVGLQTPEGRALSKARGAGFVASNWLENDGDQSDQADAADRWPAPVAVLGQRRVVHLSGKRAVRDFKGCRQDDIVVTNQDIEFDHCRVLNPRYLRKTGAVAVWLDRSGGLRSETVRMVTGHRLWSRWPDTGPIDHAALFQPIKQAQVLTPAPGK